MKGHDVVFSSIVMDWCTPQVVLDAVRRVAPIALDPCGSRSGLVNAEVTFHYDDGNGQDGLALEWDQYADGLIYVNCPYGNQLKPWSAKIRDEMFKGQNDIVALVPVRTDTAWWSTLMECADAVCFWKGRLTFLGAPAGAPFPSAVVFAGRTPGQVARFRAAFEPHGHVLFL